jgi:Protein of unknown function (DUF3606)
MSAAKSRRNKLNKPRQLEIRVNSPAELRAWARYWRCSQRDIRDAVHSAGVMVVDVQDWLKVNVVPE